VSVRGRRVGLARVGAAVLVSYVVVACSASSQAARIACKDTLTSDAVSDLQSYVSWLHDNHVDGAIGEVGWPAATDVAQWSELASQWDALARQAKLPVLMWAASEWLPSTYPLRVASAAPGATDLSILGPQLQLLLNANSKTQLVGVNDVGTEFGTPAGFSNLNPGTYGVAWHFDSAQSLAFIAAQGITTVRVPIRWERLQPNPNGPLDPQAVTQLSTYLADAHTAGLSVILDVHNFGAYDEGTPGSSSVQDLALGSSQLPDAAFAQFWTELVKTFGGAPAISGWDLMNEPAGLPKTDGSSAKTWEVASQAAVDAIRKTGDKHAVWVEGYDYAATSSFASLTPKAWIKDPAHSVIYEAHAYFDQDGSGQYSAPYATQETAAQAALALHSSPPANACLPNS
jgi:hypothetical protein